MKKKTIVIAALVVILAILGTGTLAYFTTRTVVHNVITTSGIQIELVEKMLTAGGQEVDFDDQTGIMPGAKVSKIVRVKNLDADAFIRIRVTKSVKVNGKALDAGVITMNFNTGTAGNQWTEKDGWYYYNSPVVKGAETSNLFTEVAFAGEAMDNDYQNADIAINVEAQAVQSDNNGTSAVAAAGWPVIG